MQQQILRGLPTRGNKGEQAKHEALREQNAIEQSLIEVGQKNYLEAAEWRR